MMFLGVRGGTITSQVRTSDTSNSLGRTVTCDSPLLNKTETSQPLVRLPEKKRSRRSPHDRESHGRCDQNRAWGLLVPSSVTGNQHLCSADWSSGQEILVII